ncbi:MAG: hypothetical protein EBY92_07675 [Actinobacteria bacterium]|nr:hypothetical protein [Actinomycetota bacterium]
MKNMVALFAQNNPGNLSGTWVLVIGIVVAILGLIVLLVAFNIDVIVPASRTSKIEDLFAAVTKRVRETRTTKLVKRGGE